MKTRFICGICLIICLIAIGSNAIAFDLSSPRATVHSFVGSYNQGNLQQAALCVADADPKKMSLLAELAKWQRDNETPDIIINKLDTTIDDSDKTADVIITLQFGELKEEFNDVPDQFISHLKLNFQDGEWKIVADEFKFNPSLDPQDFLSYVISLVADPESIEIVHQYQRMATCQSNLKQLGLAIFMFTQDHDETYAFTKDNWIELLKPYITPIKRPLFICSDDKTPHQQPNETKTSYSFNDHLANVSEINIEHLSKIVMLYEGKNGELNFRHNDKANVAFADGHVKAIGREEAKTLLWEP